MSEVAKAMKAVENAREMLQFAIWLQETKGIYLEKEQTVNSLVFEYYGVDTNKLKEEADSVISKLGNIINKNG